MREKIKNLPRIARFPRPEDGLRAMAKHAPQAEAFAASWIERVRPLAYSLYLLRRRIATAAVAISPVSLFLHVMFGANGMVVYKQKRAEFQCSASRLCRLQQDNDRYPAQVQALNTDRTAIEKEAREELSYVKPGRVRLCAPPLKLKVVPSNHTAKK